MQERKRQGRAVSAAQREYNQYIVAATSFGEEVLAAGVLELYRARRQIELAFKRLKSLFGYGRLPGRVETGVYAWFYGTLLLAALCERPVNAGRSSTPSGAAHPVARERLSLWREVYVARVLLLKALLASFKPARLSTYLRILSWTCADSKRKRIPQLSLFNSS